MLNLEDLTFDYEEFRIDNTDVIAYCLQLNNVFSRSFFSKLGCSIDDDFLFSSVELIKKTEINLKQYLNKCSDELDKAWLKVIYIERLMQISLQITKNDEIYWGFVTYMEAANSFIYKIFNELVDFMAKKVEFKEEDEYLSVEGEVPELFVAIDSLDEKFFRYGEFGYLMADKWYALMNGELND